MKLLTVSVIEERSPANVEAQMGPADSSSIHIELADRVSIGLEGDVDAATVRLFLKSTSS